MVAVVDHDTGMLSYCSAGHPPAFLRRAKTGEVIRLSDANGPVLGPLDDVDYDEGIVAVSRRHPGDVHRRIGGSRGLAVSAGISRAESVVAAGPRRLYSTPPALSKKLARRLAPTTSAWWSCSSVNPQGLRRGPRVSPLPRRLTRRQRSAYRRPVVEDDGRHRPDGDGVSDDVEVALAEQAGVGAIVTGQVGIDLAGTD